MISGSKAKNFITHGTASSLRVGLWASAPGAKSPRAMRTAPSDPVHSRNPELGEACSCHGGQLVGLPAAPAGDAVSVFQSRSLYRRPCKRGPEQRQSAPLLARCA